MCLSLPTLRIISHVCTRATRAGAPEQQRRIRRAVGSLALPLAFAPGTSTRGRVAIATWRRVGKAAPDSSRLLRRPRDSSGQFGAVGTVGFLLGMIMMQQRRSGEEDVHCQSATAAAVIRGADGKSLGDTSKDSVADSVVQSDRERLRASALSYLTGILLARISTGEANPLADLHDEEDGWRSGVLRRDDVVDTDEGDGDEDQLPEHIYDVDKVLANTPLLRKDNAFHDTLNSSDTISCPYVLNRPGREGTAGIQAVVRFGKSTAGHPQTVHGGITALTFDNLLGWALFLQGTGAVFTASLKVDYKTPLPCLTTAVVDVTVDRVEGRKLFVTSRLSSLDGQTLYASAEALFIKPRPKSAEKGV